MSDVFISYSRKNSEFARRLFDHLEEDGRESWVDWEEIPLSAPNWWWVIREGIENSDSFIFIMSPDSMASVVCNLELDYATELGKRIIPVMYQNVETREAFGTIADYIADAAMEERLEGRDPLVMARNNWQRLSHINWVYFRQEDDFDSAFDSLITTVETDLEYVKAHTRYLTRVQEWQRNKQRSDLLLFGEEIERAENWLIKAENYAKKQSSDKEDVVNPLAQDIQREYIALSRKEDTRRKRLARSAQASIAVLAVVLIIGLGLLYTTQQQVANAQGTLTPIPQTLAFVEGQVTNAVEAQNEAQEQANIAGTQVNIANEQLMTATQALVTATRVAELEAEGQATLGAVNTLVADAIVTVTESAINFEIINEFANAIVNRDSFGLHLNQMNNLVERYPDEALAYVTRGLVYADQYSYELAIADYDHAIQLNPSNKAFIYNNRGMAYVELQDYNQAIEDFDRAIELNPQLAEAYSNRGLAYLKLQDYNQAIEDFDRAIELNPQLAEAYSNRGLAYFESSNYEAAIQDFDRAIELNPQLAKAYGNRGLAYFESSNYEAAIQDHDRAIELDPQYAEAYRNRGLIFSDFGNYEAAIDDYNRAIELNPQDADVMNARGAAYYNLQDYETAIDDYNRAIELNLQLAEAYHNRGTVYNDLEEYEQAISDFDRAIELNPQLAEAYIGRGATYANLGGYEQAITDYDRAIELNPQLAEAYINRGVIYTNLGGYEQAIADFDRAIELNSQFASILYNYICWLQTTELGEHESALENCNSALELDPENWEYLDSRCWAKNGLGDYEGAIADCSRAIELSPNSSSYQALGDAYYGLLDYELAIDAYQQYEQLAGQLESYMEERITEMEASLEGE